MKQGYLILETGEIFEGTLFGSTETVIGEVVFNTSMTGYQEIITDPSYAGQIVSFCYPLIGNYGINPLDNESGKPHLSGVVVGDLCQSPSHYLSVQSFAAHLELAGVAGICGVDTRALAKTIRTKGTVRGVISRHANHSVLFNHHHWGFSWVTKVSTKEIMTYPNTGSHIVLIDYGYKKSILDALLNENCKVTVVPYTCPFAQIKALQLDGILLSNGPGDPMELQSYFQEIKKIIEAFPTLGICLGHQLIALAFGAKTAKLTFGHRGGNHPVKEIETGKVWITSQNHGYVVLDASIPGTNLQVTYRNVNDGSIEGLKHAFLPIQSVQFHPEAHAGPKDTEHIFRTFIQQVIDIGDVNYAVT